MRTTPPSLDQLRRERQAALQRLSPEQLAATGLNLGEVAAAAATRVQTEYGRHSVSALESIADPEVREVFEYAWERTKSLYMAGRYFEGVAPPLPEEFAEAGLDFALFAQHYTRMEQEGLQPEILITAHLSKQDTIALFADATIDGTIPNNPLKSKSGGDGLYVNEEITYEVWGSLDTPSPLQPNVMQPDATVWTIALTSGTAEPQRLNQSHQELDDGVPALTLSQYARLQLGRIQVGKPPVDSYPHWNWLKGTFEGASRAPYGYWGPDSGQVRLGWSDVDGQGGSLGARPAVW